MTNDPITPRAGNVHPAMPETMFALGTAILHADQIAVLSTHNLHQLITLNGVPWNARVTIGIAQFLAEQLRLEHGADTEIAAIWCDHEQVLRYWNADTPDAWDTLADLERIDQAILRDAVEEVRREQSGPES